LRTRWCFDPRSWRFTVTRTFGAAIGALLFVFFMSYIATRLVHPVSAASSQRVASAPVVR